jgi:hypothetical protein
MMVDLKAAGGDSGRFSCVRPTLSQDVRMKLGDDLKSPVALRVKGWLFLVLGLIASILLLAEDFNWPRLGLLVVAVWGFCRFYYFLFHVLERYAGRNRPYAGLLDAMAWALRGREEKGQEKS